MNTEKKLYQWDTGQKLAGCTGLYVDFPIGDEVYRVETVDGTCIIPDELLQTSGGHKVYECMTNNTIRSFAFSITPRPKPPDYVYTPTERLTFEGLVQKVDDAVADMIRRAESGEFDGHTPVKGTDYFTTAEIQQIQNEVSSGAIGEFKSVVDTETETFNNNAETKLNAYNQNDSQKTNAYNSNATEKLNAYNANATGKLNAYNTNANNRVAEFDSHTEQIQTDISGLKSDLINNGLTSKAKLIDYGSYNLNSEGAMTESTRNSYIVKVNDASQITIDLTDIAYRGWFSSYPKVGDVCLEQTRTFTQSGKSTYAVSENAKYLFVSMPVGGTMTVTDEVVGLKDYVDSQDLKMQNEIDDLSADRRYSVVETAFIDGEFVGNNGNISNSDTLSRTEIIDVLNAKSISVNFSKTNQYISSVAFYNSCYLITESAVQLHTTVVKDEDIEVPKNAKYAVVSVETSKKSELIIKIDNSQTYINSKKIERVNHSNEIGVFFGDSIMYGVGVLNYSGGMIDCNAPDYASRILGSKIYNAGLGGATLTRPSTPNGNNFCELVDAICGITNWDAIDLRVENAIAENICYTNLRTLIGDLKELDFNTVDFILIAYGTNDWTANKPIGEDTSTSDGEIVGALKYCINTLLSSYPQLKIYMAAPAYRWNKTSGIDSDEETHLDKNLREYADGIVHASNLLGIPCKNLYTDGMINKYNREKFLSDGVHRNKDGYKLLGEQYAKFIMSN